MTTTTTTTYKTDTKNTTRGAYRQLLRDTVVTDQDLGTNKPLLKAGDTQKMSFQSGDKPPFYAPHLKEPDYIDKPKGIKQVLHERGLLRPKMTKSNTDPSMSMEATLGSCSDFANQRSILEENIGGRGHLFDMSPKFGCEIAGVGIEYSWGKCKIYFRKHCTFKGSDLKPRVAECLKSVDLSLSRGFARICRDYMMAYRQDGKGCELAKLRKVFKSHRSALDSHFGMLSQA